MSGLGVHKWGLFLGEYVQRERERERRDMELENNGNGGGEAVSNE